MSVTQLQAKEKVTRCMPHTKQPTTTKTPTKPVKTICK